MKHDFFHFHYSFLIMIRSDPSGMNDVGLVEGCDKSDLILIIS